jgi:hypothetical protein
MRNYRAIPLVLISFTGLAASTIAVSSSGAAERAHVARSSLAADFDGFYYGTGNLTATGAPGGPVSVPWASGNLPVVIVEGNRPAIRGGTLHITGTARNATAVVVAPQSSGLGLVTVTYRFHFAGKGPAKVVGTFSGQGTDQSGNAVTYSGSFTGTKRG